jgi:fused signal recognition particle receptor
MFGLLNKFKQGLKKTSAKLFGSIKGLFGFKSIDAKTLEQLEEALYLADFGVATTEDILKEIRSAWKQEKTLQGAEASNLGATVLKRVLAGADIAYKPQPTLEVLCLIGVNGAGKTTTAAKLAHYFKLQGKKVLLAACDTFRAAANEQIQVWADALDLDIITSHPGADAAAVAFDAYQAAQSRGCDILIIDTAGRLHTKTNLMAELQKIRRTLQKQDPLVRQQNWLVLDGNTGSNSIEQAKVFHETCSVNGLIITKLDGTSRGGALVAIYRELKLPIYFVGLGEAVEDLQPFAIDPYVEAIFGSHE